MVSRLMHGKWVLIAGTGIIESHELPVEVAWATTEVSRSLALGGYSLITGDWPGVDELAAQTYAAELRPLGVPVSQHLKQIVADDEPYERLVKDGDIKHTDTMFDANLCKLGLADAAVLIGGVGGTLKMFRASQLVRKPAFPLAGTGGDAEEAFRDIISGWRERPVAGASLEEFSKLGRPIKTKEDSQQVAADLTSLINKIVGPQTQPRETLCLILTSRGGGPDDVQRAIAEAVKGAGVRPVIIGAGADHQATNLWTLRNEIERADMIVADITGASSNIMYELGIAHALRKPALHIVDKSERGLPAELGDHECYVYDPAKGTSELLAYITHWVKREKGVKEQG